MNCPDCGAKTVTEQGFAERTSVPVQQQFRQWCGCGWRGDWVWRPAEPMETALARKWSELNRRAEEFRRNPQGLG